ncbi:hypothetical protein JCM33374_g5118 [Metschnikowia sp. JCM 33374]|nr:hypothetical protein JCM33374_g5118 [Metschnikowia sp. JCM 33374]
MKKNANTKALPLKGEYRNDHQPGLIDINMRDYRDYSRPSAKCFRDVCQDSINRYGLESSIRKDRVAKLQPVPLKQPKRREAIT